PLGVGPDPETLRQAAPGLLWLAAILSVLISLDRLFQADFEDGTLDILRLSPMPLELMVLAKVLAHWLTACLPLVLAGPLLCPILGLPVEAMVPTGLTLLAGTPALSLIGAIGAALSVGVRRGGLLIAAICLPLFAPTLIFGAGALKAAVDGTEMLTPLVLLAAQSLFALAIAPWAAAGALRVNMT
ncbi:MAG TPA: heme exporter protein CcmB, partial [Alphaproteobacteria bacterium]|nr:heme exporter protein CcmB [Alphaproteobacteria bacterium]